MICTIDERLIIKIEMPESCFFQFQNPNNLNQLFYSDTFGIKKEQKHKEEQNVPRPVRNVSIAGITSINLLI